LRRQGVNTKMARHDRSVKTTFLAGCRYVSSENMKAATATKKLCAMPPLNRRGILTSRYRHNTQQRKNATDNSSCPHFALYDIRYLHQRLAPRGNDDGESNFHKLLELLSETDPSILGCLSCVLIHDCHTCCYYRCSF